MRKRGVPLALVACGLGGYCALFSAPLLAQQPDATEERIKKLEEELDAVTQELKKLKEEAASKQKPPAASTETEALQKEVNQLKGEIAETKEQASATDLEQSCVRAYLGPGLVFDTGNPPFTGRPGTSASFPNITQVRTRPMPAAWDSSGSVTCIRVS